MKVSVIIPALNEQSRIADSVQNAWAAGADEVIIADGGSSDGTAEIAHSLNCRCLSSPRGRAIQQNLGADQATGDVLLFLHADNWLASAAISQMRTALVNSNVTHGAFRQKIDARGIAYRALERGNALRVQWLGLPFGDQGMFVRRRVFEELGKFPAVGLLEDLILAKRLCRIAWPKLLPGPLHVDARRWKKHGVVQQTIRNWLLLSAYKLGVSPDRLADFYAM